MEEETPFLHPQHEDEGVKRNSLWSGDSVKSLVYAGLDAIITCFSLISSISAGHLSSVDVLVLGFANLVADGISMGFSDFVSTSTEREMAKSVRATTARDVTDDIRKQQSELLTTYQELGMDMEDAATVVRVFSKYRDILVDEKLIYQKGMLPPRQSEKPWKNGLITFVCFILFGSVPLLSFIVLIPFTRNDSIKFLGACILSAVALVLLGMAKARISGQKYFYSISATLSNGCVAAAFAYLTGWSLGKVASLHD